MAIIKTGAIYNSLIFGGINSADYGIYITGEAVFDAPKRAVNMVSVPGRNGAVAVDQGYWENIKVTYPAGTFADSETNFAAAVSDFRNALASQVGYQRLTDSYHPSEYRMGMFIDGLDVEPVHYNEAGQFTLTFNCKPQRWLTSGESSTAITSGDTLTNPTLHDASPLLVADGYGTINIGSQSIEIDQKELGTITVCESESQTFNRTTGRYATVTLTLDTSNLNTSDIITLGSVKSVENISEGNVTSIVENDPSGLNGASFTWSISGSVATVRLNLPAGKKFTYGTASTLTFYDHVTFYQDSIYQEDYGFGLKITYDGASSIEFKMSKYGGLFSSLILSIGEITAYSTVTVLDTIYIDLDVGEAYWIQNDVAVDANSIVSLGSDLPVLVSGSNTITYDNTITSLTVTPRWWQL